MNDDLTFLATSRAMVCSQVLDKRLVGYWTLQYVEAGAVWVAYDERAFVLTRPSFFPAYPGPRLRFHASTPGGTWFHRHVAFQGPRVARWVSSGLWPTVPQDAPDAPDAPASHRDWGAFFDELCDLSRRVDTIGRLRAVNCLEGLLLELADARAPESVRADDPWLARAFDSLEASGDFSPNYAKIAASSGCSVSTLRRRLKAALGGTSLHEYVIARRTSRARALLVETDLSLSAIAERLGYDNPFYFARQFKQRAGVTPGTYRKSRM